MINIHIFGATTLSAEALRQRLGFLNIDLKVFNYSRSNKNYEEINLDKYQIFNSQNNKFKDSLLVSFAPIWSLCKFLEDFSINSPDSFSKINSIILCSSSSVVTKRYSFNNFDKNLSKKLLESENKIIEITNKFKIPCIIIQPTMIYGAIGEYRDENINKIIKIMRRSPFLIMPKSNGFRQPIHAYQLAEIIIHYIKSFLENRDNFHTQKILVGGDFELSYLDILKIIKEKLPSNDSVNNCRLFIVPDLVFIIFSILLLLKSTKSYEASLRIFSDLSGFKKCFQIINSKKRFFPIKPFY